MIRGPRSRAGLIAYPVGPPNANPITRTRSATGSAPVARTPPTVMVPVMPATLINRPPENLMAIATTPKTSMKVPMISVTRLAAVLRIAGPVQKTASLRPGSSVSGQWGK